MNVREKQATPQGGICFSYAH